MKTIYYNSSVAQLCGKNGITKAVLLNYIYNYHKANTRKKAGHPAAISLSEFVYAYTYDDKPLWSRTHIHKMLQALHAQRLITVTRDEQGRYAYGVCAQVAEEMRRPDGTWIGFDLGLACVSNVYIAVVHRFLVQAIQNSPNGVAYGLDVDQIAATNCISASEIYRTIKGLVDLGYFQKVSSPVRRRSRRLNLALGDAGNTETV